MTVKDFIEKYGHIFLKISYIVIGFFVFKYIGFKGVIGFILGVFTAVFIIIKKQEVLVNTIRGFIKK